MKQLETKHGPSHLPLDVEECVDGCEQQREEDAPEEDGEPAKLHSGNADGRCTVGLYGTLGRHLVQKEHPDDKGGGHDGSRVILLPDLHVDVVERHVVLGPKHWHGREI